MVTVELTWDAVDKIVVDQLKYFYSDICRGIELRKQGHDHHRYHHDSAKDILAMEKRLEALALILSDYGEDVELPE